MNLINYLGQWHEPNQAQKCQPTSLYTQILGEYFCSVIHTRHLKDIHAPFGTSGVEINDSCLSTWCVRRTLGPQWMFGPGHYRPALCLLGVGTDGLLNKISLNHGCSTATCRHRITIKTGYPSRNGADDLFWLYGAGMKRLVLFNNAHSPILNRRFVRAHSLNSPLEGWTARTFTVSGGRKKSR